MYIKAEKGPGLSVIYIDANGNRHVKKGGDLNWRCNNPCNLKQSDFTTRHEAIGSYKDSGGTWAIFPTREAGMAAAKALLTGPTYSDETIYTAMGEYIDVSNSRDYRPALESKMKSLGINIHKVHFGEMLSKPDKLDILMLEIERNEGSTSTPREEYDMKKIVGAHENKRDIITTVQVEGADYVPKGSVAADVEAGKVDGVAVDGPSGPYVRKRPNTTTSDNLGEIATPEK